MVQVELFFFFKPNSFRSVSLRTSGVLAGPWEEYNLVGGRSVLIAAALRFWHLKVKLGHVGCTHFFSSALSSSLENPPRSQWSVKFSKPVCRCSGAGETPPPPSPRRLGWNSCSRSKYENFKTEEAPLLCLSPSLPPPPPRSTS